MSHESSLFVVDGPLAAPPTPKVNGPDANADPVIRKANTTARVNRFFICFLSYAFCCSPCFDFSSSMFTHQARKKGTADRPPLLPHKCCWLTVSSRSHHRGTRC